MKLAPSAVSVLTGTLLVGAATPAHPQQFEGIVTIKSLHLTPELVTAQMGEDEQDEQKAREKIFALTIDQLVQLGARTKEQRMQLKGTHLRSAEVQMPGMGSGYGLMDLATGVMRTVLPSQRGYYEISLRDLPTFDSEPAAEQPQVEPLGRIQMVGGLRCTGYRVTEGDKMSLVWTTGDAAYRDFMQTYLRLISGMRGGKGEGLSRETAFASSFLERYGYPVLRQELAEDKGYTVEVYSLVRQPLADSMFAVPSGFQKLHMPGMR